MPIMNNPESTDREQQKYQFIIAAFITDVVTYVLSFGLLGFAYLTEVRRFAASVFAFIKGVICRSLDWIFAGSNGGKKSGDALPPPPSPKTFSNIEDPPARKTGLAGQVNPKNWFQRRSKYRSFYKLPETRTGITPFGSQDIPLATNGSTLSGSTAA